MLVTAFGVVTHHRQLGGHVAADALARTHAAMVHGIDDVFAIGLVFTVAAMALIAVFVRTSPASGSSLSVDDSDAVVDEAEEWLAALPVAEAG